MTVAITYTGLCPHNNKLRYPSHSAAAGALRACRRQREHARRRHRRTRRREQSTYKCPHCDGWHLSSR